MSQQVGIGILELLIYGVGCFGSLLLIGALLYSLIKTKTRNDNETRCRKCRHILRGITEPRCPECGERI